MVFSKRFVRHIVWSTTSWRSLQADVTSGGGRVETLHTGCHFEGMLKSMGPIKSHLFGYSAPIPSMEPAIQSCYFCSYWLVSHSQDIAMLCLRKQLSVRTSHLFCSLETTWPPIPLCVKLTISPGSHERHPSVALVTLMLLVEQILSISLWKLFQRWMSWGSMLHKVLYSISSLHSIL